MWVAIGRFGRPHGVRGEVRFWPFNASSDLATAGQTIRVGRRKTECAEYRILRARRDAKGLVLALEGLTARDEAKSLTHQLWFASRGDFPELDSGEFYFVDLIGFDAVLETGESIGRIKDVLEVGPSEIFVIDRGGREAMVPNVEALVPRIDMEAHRVVIRPIDGLLES